MSALVDHPSVKHVLIDKQGLMAISQADGSVLLDVPVENGLYPVDIDTEVVKAFAAAVDMGVQHSALGHLSNATVNASIRAGAINGVTPIKEGSKLLCDPCMRAGQAQLPVANNKRAHEEATRVLGRLHMDLAGPFPPSLEGYTYRCVIVDE